jgi:hypothetical protein
MNKLTSFSALSAVCSCCSILVACNAGNYGRGVEALSPDTHASAENRSASSWLDDSARKKSRLLYVTDSNNASVTAYTYDDGQLVGTLQGFSDPSGLCVDNAGDIFVTDTLGEKVYEYAHGGAEPINELNTNGQQPVGCSVDPLTANLAVAYVSGVVGIYRNARGSAKFYTAEGADAYYCSYDERGNLFVDGLSYYSHNSHFQLVELARGKHRFDHVSIDGSIGSPGQVQWDGKYLAVGDNQNNVVDRIEVSGTHGTIQKTVHFNNVQLAGFWIQGNHIIDPEPGDAQVLVLRYPKGGTPTRTITDGIDGPLSAVVSDSFSK